MTLVNPNFYSTYFFRLLLFSGSYHIRTLGHSISVDKRLTSFSQFLYLPCWIQGIIETCLQSLHLLTVHDHLNLFNILVSHNDQWSLSRSRITYWPVFPYFWFILFIWRNCFQCQDYYKLLTPFKIWDGKISYPRKLLRPLVVQFRIHAGWHVLKHEKV